MLKVKVLYLKGKLIGNYIVLRRRKANLSIIGGLGVVARSQDG
jgi:hypothetical protein